MNLRGMNLVKRVSETISFQRKEVYYFDTPRQIGKSTVSAILSNMDVLVFAVNQASASHLCKLGAKRENVFVDMCYFETKGINLSKATAIIFDEGFHREDLEYDILSLRSLGYKGPIIVLGTSREMEMICHELRGEKPGIAIGH